MWTSRSGHCPWQRGGRPAGAHRLHTNLPGHCRCAGAGHDGRHLDVAGLACKHTGRGLHGAGTRISTPLMLCHMCRRTASRCEQTSWYVAQSLPLCAQPTHNPFISGGVPWRGRAQHSQQLNGEVPVCQHGMCVCGAGDEALPAPLGQRLGVLVPGRAGEGSWIKHPITSGGLSCLSCDGHVTHACGWCRTPTTTPTGACAPWNLPRTAATGSTASLRLALLVRGCRWCTK